MLTVYSKKLEVNQTVIKIKWPKFKKHSHLKVTRFENHENTDNSIRKQKETLLNALKVETTKVFQDRIKPLPQRTKQLIREKNSIKKRYKQIVYLSHILNKITEKNKKRIETSKWNVKQQTEV